MKWFKRWFRNQCIHAWETKDDDSEIVGENPISAGPRTRVRVRTSNAINGNDIRTPNGNGVNFVLYPATGGNILEVRIFDERTGDSSVSLHIITLDQDLGESIGKIITLEALKR